MSNTFRAPEAPLSIAIELLSNAIPLILNQPTIVALSGGQTVYRGSCRQMTLHFASAGYDCPQYMNPAEYFISLVNTDFDDHADVPQMVQSYTQSEIRKELINRIKSDRKTLQH
ncbi:hypothetical protein PPTG_09544 [Phytophthora nicotianae INRA-310]|uniref:Uncharacterized protein n=2 Tax=Phytophthora nicotianae TaxID=4792 RepID=W2QH98_PHYN3|nr:hypothetical protein PPTG_09544 [Phytophthora nicotianae INRA-310]ETN11874.1 hypothetical protein PPTG_09544 [Phytophthora nicotianae INRA-310]